MAKKKCIEIPFDELHKLFRYNPETGKLSWKVANARRIRVGDEAGSTDTFRGRSVRRVKVAPHGSILVHRIAWALSHGKWSTYQIDHRDGNALNNKLDNLREATNSKNCRNRKIREGCSSGYKGVIKIKRTGRWWARITVDGVQHSLNVHNTPEQAAKAYDKAAKVYHGEFAKLNFPEIP